MVQKGIKMDIIKKIAEELQIRPDQVQAVVNLIDEGNTIPFIARYRKEAHGALNDEILRNLDERLTDRSDLKEKVSVLASMEELGVLTDDLKKKMDEHDISRHRRSLSSISSKAPYKSDNCKRKRLRAACK